MEILHFASNHLSLLIGAAIVGSSLFIGVQLRHIEKAQRMKNLLTITKHHREIWSELYERSELKRILDPNVNLKRKPVSSQEAFFVTFLILHLKASFDATNQRMFITPEALGKDIHWLFSMPIPRQVWDQSQSFQDRAFVQFVEKTLADFASVDVR